MPGFDGTGPLCLGSRVGRCLLPGGGLLFNLVVVGLGIYAIKQLFKKNASRSEKYIKSAPIE